MEGGTSGLNVLTTTLPLIRMESGVVFFFFLHIFGRCSIAVKDNQESRASWDQASPVVQEGQQRTLGVRGRSLSNM
jgi:hypothetical protein